MSIPAFAEDNSYKKLFIKNSIDNLKDFIIKSKENSFVGNTLSVDEIYDDYTNNELAANKKYKDKNLRIKATINQIKEDVFGNAFIIVKLKNSIIGNAHFKVDEKDPRILGLSKNNNIDLICQFDEFSLDSLSFNQCLFTDQFVDGFLDPVRENLLKVDDENYKPESKVEAALSSIPAAYPTDVINSVCKRDFKNCTADNIQKSKFYPKTVDKDPVDVNTHVDMLISKYGKEWFKSLPKYPTAK